jgi:hypothetical protein
MFIQVNSLLLHPSLKTKVVKNMYHYNYSQPCGCHANAIYESIPKTSRLSWRWYRTEKYQTGNSNMSNTHILGMSYPMNHTITPSLLQMLQCSYKHFSEGVTVSFLLKPSVLKHLLVHDGGGDAWMLVQLNDMKKTYSVLLINEPLTLNHLR